MKINLKIISIVAILLLSNFNSFARELHSKDSIIINFDNNTKILIYVKDKSDLDKLKNYDINTMLKDISLSIDTANEQVKYLKIEDETGNRYLRDTTIVFTDDEHFEDVKKERGDNVARIKLGNYKVEIDMDEIEDIEDTFDDFDNGLKVKSTVEKERRHRRTTHELNVELGLNNFLEDKNFPDGDAPYNVKPFGSWYVGISSVLKTAVVGPLFIEWGGNVNWYNFKMENTNIRILKTENGTEFIDVSPEIDGNKSKLTASFINLSFVPVLDFSRGYRKVKKFEIDGGGVSISKYKKQSVRIGFGGYAGYRLGSHTKFKFKENGNKDKDKTGGNFNLNNFRYGLRGQLGYKGFDLFVNYDLNELFNENKGPKLNAISFGIIL